METQHRNKPHTTYLNVLSHMHGIYHTDSIRYFEYPIGGEPGETTSRLSI